MKNCLLILLAFFFFTSFTFSQTFQWEQLNGPFGGTALCFTSNSSGNIFSGLNDYKGFFRSLDEGLTWQSINNGVALDYRNVGWMVVDGSDNLIASAGSHVGGYIFKSTDNGESWTSIAPGFSGSCVAQNDSGWIYVANTGYNQHGVSKDGGYTWNHYSGGGVPCVAINDSDHIFFGGNYGSRSTDYGLTWTQLTGPDNINSIAVAPNGNLYLGCSREYATNSGVYKSTDNGDSWTPVKEGFRVYASNNIAINDDGDIFVGSYGWGIWRSTDEGANWTQQNSGLWHFYIKSMHIDNNGYVYAGTSEGGIYRSTDNGESWQQVGVTAVGVKRMAISPLNGFIFTSVSGIARSTDSGLSWKPINNGLSDLDVRAITIKNDGTIFCGVGTWATGVVYRSTNNGNNWERSDNGLPHHDVSGLTFDAEGNVYVSIDYNGVHKSTDNGITWSNIGDPPGGKLAFNSIGDLFLASYGGGMWKLPTGDSVWVSLGGTYIYTFFVGSNDNLYTDQARSTDNGVTWTNMPLGNMAYSYAENSQGHLFAGTFNYGSGVKRSTDFGETWESINSNIPTQDVRCVAVDSDGYLYAGPWGYSLYKTTTSTVTFAEDIRFTPANFYLEQNYPNPFNPSTTINWQSPVGSHQTIKLFDVLGRELETIVDGYYDAGSHSTLCIVHSTLPSGVYFYQLKTGSFVETKKMILLR